MAAPTAKSAVSDYEHLKFRFADENQNKLDESEDDFLPLKSKIKQLGDQLTSSEVNRYDEFLSDNLDSIANVPLQSAWSPGMVVKPNPSLLISPEKDSSPLTDLTLERDNILEPRDLNKVPAPVVWSPYPSLKPSVFVTPEKTTAFSSVKNLQAQKSSVLKETTKSKEKQSVRFELPTSLSEDDLPDRSALSNCLSPITVKGKDIGNQEDEGCLFNPSKVYNPLTYSDDSFDKRDSVSTSTATNLVEKLNQLLQDSTNFENPLVSKDSTNLSSTNKRYTDNRVVKDSMCLNASKHDTDIKHNNLNTNVKKTFKHSSGDKGPKQIQIHNRKSKPGPHHLSSSPSPYFPPTSGACIVREAKHPVVSTEYSYPFQSSPSQGGEEYEHIFSRPEFNSTLKVRSELDDLCDQEVDVQKAAEIKLSKCSAKKMEIQEKAAVYTNHISDQFVNLVDVEPSIDRLCDRVVRMRTGGRSKVSHYKKGTKSKKETTCETAPDLMEFYSEDLQKEVPDLSLPGVVPTLPDLCGAPHDLAFDCYRHHRVWSGLQDF